MKQESELKQRNDSLQNVLTQFGTSKDSSTAYTYEAEAIVPDIELTQQYEQHGIFSKIINTPAEECFRRGYDFEGLEENRIKKLLQSSLTYIDFDESCLTAMKWGRLYGGSIIVMLTDDGKDLRDPLDLDAITKIDELRVFERAVVHPDYQSMYNIGANQKAMQHGRSKFGMPEFYRVNSQYGTFDVHESRCIVIRNGRLPERTMKGEWRFWGVPEYARIHRQIMEFDIATSYAVRLLERSVIPVYAMKGLSSKLEYPGGQQMALDRIELIDMARSALNTFLMDADGESFTFQQSQLSGVNEVIESACSALSAVSMIPQTNLFGRSPAGMNATGDSDLENFYGFIGREQTTKVRPALEIITDLLLICMKNRGLIDEIPEYEIAFNPLKPISDQEQAQVDQMKAQTQQVKAQTQQMYIDMNVLDPSEVRKALASEGEIEIETMLDDLPEEDLLEMPDTGLSEEFENSDSKGTRSRIRSKKRTRRGAKHG